MLLGAIRSESAPWAAGITRNEWGVGWGGSEPKTEKERRTEREKEGETERDEVLLWGWAKRFWRVNTGVNGPSVLTHNPTRPAGTGRGNRACLNSNPPEEIYRVSFCCWFIHLWEDKHFFFFIIILIQNYACSSALVGAGVHAHVSPRTCCLYKLAVNVHSLSWDCHCPALVGCSVGCGQDLRVHHRHRQRNYHRYLVESALVTPEIWSHDRPPAGPTAHLLTVPGMMGADLPLSGSRTSRFINGGGEWHPENQQQLPSWPKLCNRRYLKLWCQKWIKPGGKETRFINIGAHLYSYKSQFGSAKFLKVIENNIWTYLIIS